MTNKVHELTQAGHIKKPSYSLIYSWVKTVWEKVDSSLIRKLFKCCGISINTDGTKDDEIFDYNNLLDKENCDGNGEGENENENEDEEG